MQTESMAISLTSQLRSRVMLMSTASSSNGSEMKNLGKQQSFDCFYLDITRFQHFAHLSVQENNFEMKLICWEFFLPFYFALNVTNYSRCDSYYLRLLQDIEEVYAGLKELLGYKGL